MFITLEGGDGVGKSVNLIFIKQLLETNGLSVISTREPGGTVMGEKIRQLLLKKSTEIISEHSELLLIFAARAQHIKQVIRPALAKGYWVLCDRFTDATYAYQGGGRNMSLDMIEYLEDKIQGTFRPDLTLLLDASVEVGISRVNKRSTIDCFEAEGLEFFTKVRQFYIQQAEKFPLRIKKINANQPLSKVQTEISQIVQSIIYAHRKNE